MAQRRAEEPAAAGEPRGEAGTLLVPREEWGAFLDRFTEENEETVCRLEVVGAPEMVAAVLSEERPLLAVTLDDAAGTPQLLVELGDTLGASPVTLRHAVGDPRALREYRNDATGTRALEIEAADGARTILTVNPHPGRDRIPLREIGRTSVR